VLPGPSALGQDARVTNDVTADTRAVETTWNPTRRDVRQAAVLVLGRAKYYAFASVVLVFGVVATLLGIETTDDGLSIPTLWLPFGLVCAAAFVLLPDDAGGQVWRCNPLVRLRDQVRLDATGVTSTTELVTTRFAWAALTTAYEADHFFVLATRSGSGATTLIVPKDDLNHDEYVTARELIRERVGSIH
jgi:hypothetical protein